MTSASDIIAVPEGAPTAGAIVWWRLSGGVLIDDLEEAWADAGLNLDLLPSTPTGITALRRAIQEYQGEHRLVRKLGDRSGYAIVSEIAEGRELDYNVDTRVVLGQSGLEFSWASQDFEAYIEASYAAHLSELSPSDVGSWLVKRLEACDGVKLRDTGGIYFVPHTTIAGWRIIAGAVQDASSHVVFEVPALRNETAVEAILDAISQEAKTEADRLAEDMLQDKLGARALNNRAELCSQMREKLRRYEGLLGRSLETFSERFEDLGEQLTVAALKAQSKSEKEES
jgi:hypothetical protein